MRPREFLREILRAHGRWRVDGRESGRVIAALLLVARTARPAAAEHFRRLAALVAAKYAGATKDG